MFQRNRRRQGPRFQPASVQDNLYPVTTEPVEWKSVTESDNDLPCNAFVACKLETGEEGFVAKATVNGQIVSGVTTRNGMVASIPYGSSEHLVRSFQVLTIENPNSLCWQVDSHGNVPKFAVCGGVDSHEQSYIGRTCTPLNEASTAFNEQLVINHQCEGASRVGKIHPSHHCLYISYNGREYVFPRYEVLCHSVSASNLTDICRWKLISYFQKNRLERQLMNKLPLSPPLISFLLKEKTSRLIQWLCSTLNRTTGF